MHRMMTYVEHAKESILKLLELILSLSGSQDRAALYKKQLYFFYTSNLRCIMLSFCEPLAILNTFPCTLQQITRPPSYRENRNHQIGTTSACSAKTTSLGTQLLLPSHHNRGDWQDLPSGPRTLQHIPISELTQDVCDAFNLTLLS